MKTKTLVIQLSKFMVVSNVMNNHWVGEFNGQAISWYDQEGSAVCVRLRYLSDKDDTVSDYSAGMFYDRIKRIVDSLKSGK